MTPEIYMRHFSKGAFTNPDAEIRADALAVLNRAADVVRELGARYLKVWPGQDGWDYPFQVDHHQQWELAVSGMRELALANPDLKIVIEYKPREPRNKMFWDSSAKTALGIKAMGVDNVGVLLDFGHALFGGESPAAAAQLLIDHDLLWAMDVNDNLRSWDDDMVVGTVHPVELFEFFYTLRSNGWEGVWQLDQFPFREDTVEAARLSIRFLKSDVPSPGKPRHRGLAGRAGPRGRDGRATRRPGRSLRRHGGRVVTTIEEEEDLVPHVDPSALPGGELPVLGRVPAGASREQAVAHLAEAARQVRRRDIQMVHAAGLGHIGGEFSVIDILVTLYLHAMNMSPGAAGRSGAGPLHPVEGSRGRRALHHVGRGGLPAGQGPGDLHATELTAQRPSGQDQDRGRGGQHGTTRTRVADRRGHGVRGQARRIAAPYVRRGR